VHLRKTNAARPAIPNGLLDAIEKDGKARVVLVTPAHFEQGWRPTWLLQPRDGVTPRLVGACVDRPVTVSGWDMAAPKGGQPKPTRRLAAAGSVYFIELDGDTAARRAWVERHWWQPVGDDEASRFEGFGLAAIGAGGGLW
jgi:CRISPR-associated protein Cmr3